VDSQDPLASERIYFSPRVVVHGDAWNITKATGASGQNDGGECATSTQSEAPP